MYQVIGNENLEMIEIRIHPYQTEKRVLTLYIENERPIYYDNNMIFFFSAENARESLRYSNCGASKIKNIPDEISYVYDINSVLLDLENTNCSHADDSMLLDCLQLMCDYCLDTSDPWTDRKRFQDMPEEIDSPKNQLENDEYMVPIDPIADIKDEYDYFRKILSASMYFLTEKDIDRHFQEQGYKRKDLVFAMKYLIGQIVTTSLYLT